MPRHRAHPALTKSRYSGIESWRAVRDATDVAFNLETLARLHDDAGRSTAVLTVSGADWDLLKASSHPFSRSGYVRTHPINVQRKEPLNGITPRAGCSL